MEGVDSRGDPLFKGAVQVTEVDLGDLEGHCYDGALGDGSSDREGQGVRSRQSVVAGALRGAEAETGRGWGLRGAHDRLLHHHHPAAARDTSSGFTWGGYDTPALGYM